MTPTASVTTCVDSVMFEDQIKQRDTLVLVELGAKWCEPCRRVGHQLEAIAEQRHDIRILRVDLDQNKDLARRFRVTTIPTLMVFTEGEMVERLTGALSASALNALIDRNQ